MTDIERIMRSLNDVLGGICEKTYINSIPSIVQMKGNSYMVIAINSAINESPAYGRCIADIVLYVRNRAGGNAPIDRISALQKAVISKFPIVTDYFSLTSPTVEPSVQKGDFSILVISGDLLIKTNR